MGGGVFQMRSDFSLLLASAAITLQCMSASPGYAGPAPTQTRVIALSANDVLRLGVETAPAQRARFTPQVRGYGVVMSLAAVAEADFDFRTAEAAAIESQATLQRSLRLFAQQALSQQAVDKAQHEATTDSAQLVLADRKEVAAFGQFAPWRGPPRNEALIDTIATGQSTLVQATFPLGISFAAPPAVLIVSRLSPQAGQRSWSSRLNWEGPADPAIPGRNFFALVDHAEFALGEHVQVLAPIGAPVDGVSIPSDAVILSEDRPWCYVEVSRLHFRRVPVDLKLELSDGYFVRDGIAPNEPVVTKGTGLLLAHEIGSAIPGAD